MVLALRLLDRAAARLAAVREQDRPQQSAEVLASTQTLRADLASFAPQFFKADPGPGELAVVLYTRTDPNKPTAQQQTIYATRISTEIIDVGLLTTDATLWRERAGVAEGEVAKIQAEAE
jgi:hypothetical protein